MTLSLARLRELLEYDPETGVFTWKCRAMAGRVAGCNSRGYRVIRIDWVLYHAHRLAWLYVTGSWPAKHIDHKNGDPSDNRFANLREATQSQNMMNKRVKKNNRTGLKGVKEYFGRYQARINGDHLGTFNTAEEAHAAYAAEARNRFGEFARSA